MENQKALAESVSANIKQNFLRDILVKPLEPIMVEKEITKPIPTTTVNEEGVEITEYTETETIIEQVESAFAKGVVIKLPIGQTFQFEIGDIIVYNNRMSSSYDLIKDTRLVKPYDVVSIETEE